MQEWLWIPSHGTFQKNGCNLEVFSFQKRNVLSFLMFPLLCLPSLPSSLPHLKLAFKRSLSQIIFLPFA